MKQNFINLLKGTFALGAVILPAFFSSCADENEETADCATVLSSELRTAILSS